MERYSLKKSLGENSFVKTYQAVDRKTGKDCLLKAFNIFNLERNECKCEVLLYQIVGKLQHPNIVPCQNVFIDKDTKQSGIVSDYCYYGSLDPIIQSHKNKESKISEVEVLRMFRDMLFGLNYLHNNGVIHGNLKPKNIFIDEDSNLMIGDYGPSKAFEELKTYPYPITGNHTYLSPEELKNSQRDAKTDVWSLGCIVYELCCFVVSFLFSS